MFTPMSSSLHSPTPPEWRILEAGDSSVEWTGTILYSCPYCGTDARLPVAGRVVAQLADGSLAFARCGPQRTPKTIKCSACRRQLTRGGE
jgi:hypothetical protein